MAKKRLSHDQKRKAKLAKRARKSPPATTSSLAYTGNKYKTEEYAPVMHATETGIYQAYVVTDRQLTDRAVRQALEKLVTQMRAGQLPPFDDSAEVQYVRGEEVDLVIHFIRSNWNHLFEYQPHPGTEALIGILRTLLGSVDNWSTPSPSSRGYLNFVEGFLRKTGVNVQKMAPDTMEPVEEPEDELLEIGRDWIESGDAADRADFMDLAERMIAGGDGNHVAEVAQRLIGEAVNSPYTHELSVLSVRAQNARPGLPGEGQRHLEPPRPNE
jgi:hypothetical protein